jgi:hypothetical protein
MVETAWKNDDDQPALWLEFGFFNLLMLIVILPLFWFNNLIYSCSFCCCGDPMRNFYEGNFIRAVLLFVLMGLLIPLDSVLLYRAVRQPSDSPGFFLTRCAFDRLIQGIPFFGLALAIMALPLYNLCYGLAATIAVLWSMRHSSRLGGLGCYLITLFVLIPFLLGFRVFGCDCSKISSVKANMHTLRTLAESYAVDHRGQYPKSVGELKTEAEKQRYWKDFTNPFTSLSGEQRSYEDFRPEWLNHGLLTEPIPEPLYNDVMGIRFFRNVHTVCPTCPGMVLYNVSANKYFIYGLDKSGRLIRDKGQTLVLSND